jgi:uncharacterized protein (TIGR03083 family)
VDFTRYVDHVTEQGDAMRAAAVTAGPAAAVVTCPEWTVQELVRHVARVHQWAARALLAAPGDERPTPDEPPRVWDELLAWWDEQRSTLVKTLRERGPDTPSWTFAPPHTAGFWARRQAHETAVHRLDAEHAAAGSAQPDSVPSLVFDPELAADGIDEVLHVGIPRRLRREPAAVHGTVLLHAADAGRAWLVRLHGPDPLEVGPADHPAIDADASVVGTADAVYRAVWGRPSHAVKGGDPALVSALRAP